MIKTSIAAVLAFAWTAQPSAAVAEAFAFVSSPYLTIKNFKLVLRSA